MLLALVGLGAAIWVSGLRVLRFQGQSMVPAVNPGDCFVARVGLWRPREPQRFDMLIFDLPPNSPWAAAKIPWMKRLVGLPGERVRLTGARLFINDREVPAPLHLDPAVVGPRPEVTLTLGPREYFVLGDNLDHTTDDSRKLGPIDRDLIRGVATAAVFRAR